MKFRDRFDKKYLKLMAYVILTVGMSYALILVMGQYQSISRMILRGLSWVGAIIKPVIIGGMIAYILHPLVRLVERLIVKLASGSKLGNKNSVRLHALSVVLSIILIAIVATAAISAIVFAITRQVQTLNSGSINTLINSIVSQAEAFERGLRLWLSKYNIGDGFVVKFEQNLIGWVTRLLNSGSGLQTLFSNIASGASTLLFSMMFAVYLLFDSANLRKYWGYVIRTFWSQRANDRLNYIYNDVNKVFSGYFRGAALDGLMVALLISIAFTIVGMPYGVMIGVTAGIANLIPYMGPIVGYGLTIISGVITGEIKTMLISIIIISAVQVIDGAVINPKLLSKSIDVHPMLVIIAIIAGNKVGGFVGMLAAVPVSALCKIWFERLVERRSGRRNALIQPDKERIRE